VPKTFKPDLEFVYLANEEDTTSADYGDLELLAKLFALLSCNDKGDLLLPKDYYC